MGNGMYAFATEPMGEMEQRHRIAPARDGNRKGKRRVPCGLRRLNSLGRLKCLGHSRDKRGLPLHRIAHWQAIPASADCASVAEADPGKRMPTSCSVTQASGV